ncbi:DUF4914 family protein, partial [uncultured Desulfovibrio sp.]|uniref:DUF4914 family protein n=1 Tax=uncultured Desulfovibrio sp. TaxID=167968 RepID=UPI002627FCD7
MSLNDDFLAMRRLGEVSKALCHPSFYKDNGRLCVADAEKSWFVRIDHIKKYGTDPNLESVTTNPKEPLIFFNLEAHPNATCLIWEHTEDEPGKKCPNPRIIIPREQMKNILLRYQNSGYDFSMDWLLRCL